MPANPSSDIASLLASLPGHARRWLERSSSNRSLAQIDAEELAEKIEEDAAFDPIGRRFVETNAPAGPRAEVLDALYNERPEAHAEFLKKHAKDPAIAANSFVFRALCELDADAALEVLPSILVGALYQQHTYTSPNEYGEAYRAAARRLGSGGAEIFEAVVAHTDTNTRLTALSCLLQAAVSGDDTLVAEITRRLVGSVPTPNEQEPFFGLMQKYRPALFPEVWEELLLQPLKKARAHAIEALSTLDRSLALSAAARAMQSKQSDVRKGAVALYRRLGDEAARAALLPALSSEKSAAVRAEIRIALEAMGVAVVPAPSEERDAWPIIWSELEQWLGAQRRPPKWPASWLDAATLPALPAKDEATAGRLGLAHLLATQAVHKTMSVSPEIAPLLAQIDRARSGEFALALLNAWLASAQDAKDRWALVLVGVLGDTRILPVLNSWIPKWCEKGRGKLAEYAAQAIALQGSDEALMLLDALATRYRSKQRNIGAAATQAFQAAAEARGLSADELGDVVVPAFGFDADGLRDFTWEGGAARAELGVDLKPSWSDPESDKALKGLPASAPDALKSEVKELGKLLREAAKSQTARLELALVRQRRWPVGRWRQLYETHPVLRVFATRLVWGVYGADGALLRCFRRYPNGLLADAAGGLEELPEEDLSVGMVHPLELTPETTAAWRAHLARFKVAPPFPQLERPVERLDPLHANRRELAVARGREVGAGTFRSRAERRGWQRGSVVDAGGVAGYFKSFPGAGVEVTIELEGLYIGIDPMETITLGLARFVRADSVKRGSYVYDDPQAGDARVLAFGAVPSVVYSETVGDLKAIAGIAADAAADPVEAGGEA